MNQTKVDGLITSWLIFVQAQIQWTYLHFVFWTHRSFLYLIQSYKQTLRPCKCVQRWSPLTLFLVACCFRQYLHHEQLQCTCQLSLDWVPSVVLCLVQWRAASCSMGQVELVLSKNWGEKQQNNFKKNTMEVKTLYQQNMICLFLSILNGESLQF